MQTLFSKKTTLLAVVFALTLGASAASAAEVSIKTTGGGIKISGGDHQMEIGGRLMLDLDYFDGAFNAGKGGGNASEYEVRRSRLTFKGTSNEVWSYKITYDFDTQDGEVTTTDAYLQYRARFGKIQVGKFKRPGGLEELTSSKRISTIERSSLMNSGAFEVGRPDWGVGLSDSGDNFTWSAGLFDTGEEDAAGKDERQLAGRIVFQPILTDTSVLHIGLSYLTGDTSPNRRKRIRDRFGVHATSDRLALSDAEVDDVSQYGLELAWRRGPLSVQMDYMDASWGAGSVVSFAAADAGPADDYLMLGDAGLPSATVPDAPGLPSTCLVPDPNLCTASANLAVTYDRNGTLNTEEAAAGGMDATGYSFQIAYTLTGEMRSYKQSSGVFDRVAPRKGGKGAWELVLRYENLEVDQSNDSRTYGYTRTENYRFVYDFVYEDTNSDNAINSLDAAPTGTLVDVVFISDGEESRVLSQADTVVQRSESGNALTLGVNWIPTRNVRLMANYIDADLGTRGTGAAYTFRFQYDF